ncbi:hypothetical protein TrRE_jg7924 [Triparma retinervis]|uniref:SAM domain-containing protein n=1 Tax=Triparma retinervis TaxID=2557542 RepID=A0A9W6Z8T5_9STRA|nr:hypothetical protein TrRE_jg7924 [Triparma retinervis]
MPPLSAPAAPATPATKRRLLSTLTVEEVGFLLVALGLDKHVDNFSRFGIDGVVLAALKTEKDLEGELGVGSHVQRLNLLSHIKDWTDKKGVPSDLIAPKVFERSRALSELDVHETCRLLEAIELPGVREKALDFRLDGHMLSVITEDDLKKELKVESRLQRSKLLKKVGEYNINGVPASIIADPEDRTRAARADTYDERTTLDERPTFDERPTDLTVEDSKLAHK